MAESPRFSGENLEHIRTLAESEDPLPPIIVHRRTMRIIDGMHRLQAAKMRGQEEIYVRLFDGDDASSFVLAVKNNVMHGLPLSRAERKAAAGRIIKLYPQWSDRMIASLAGLSAKAVAAQRARPNAAKQQSDTRMGRDGRVRPVNHAERQKAVIKVLEANPDASLRQVARSAGVSPETVRRVRAKMAASGKSDTIGQHGDGSGNGKTQVIDPTRKAIAPLRHLKADPAFRSTETGRSLLRMLAALEILQEHGSQLIDNIPTHCAAVTAEAAKVCAREWYKFSESIEAKGL
jgi:ParB-like chromosome segregation protein Spo0J